MSLGSWLLLLAVTALAAFGWAQWRKAATLRQRLLMAAPYVIRSGAPFGVLAPIIQPDDWKVLAQGGNTKPGEFGGINNCPCQKEYTVATQQVVLNAWPNPAQVAACAANPPAAEAPSWKCADDCVQVMTHRWHGWVVYQGIRTGQIVFNCDTFAQYHCKKPNDPDRDKLPKPSDPGDTEP